MKVVIHPEKTIVKQEVSVEIPYIKIIAIRDLFEQQRILARIEGLPKCVILWDGSEQYTAAGEWTNETAYDRATEVLSLSSIPWE
jgi:hypothetical protein